MALHDPKSIAVVHSTSGQEFTYGQLLQDVAAAKEDLANHIQSRESLQGQRVAFLVENSYDHVGTTPMAL